MMHMKKATHWFMAVCLFTSYPVFSQEGGAAREKIETAKIGFITNRLNLTSEQAPKFWPVYNEYNAKKQEIRRALRPFKTASATATDEQLLADMKEMIHLRQKEVDLEKDYMNRFLKVINPRQLAQLYHTEQDFRKELLKMLRDQRGGGRRQR
jgi:Spy/CpxP family protein refolding chaperone